MCCANMDRVSDSVWGLFCHLVFCGQTQRTVRLTQLVSHLMLRQEKQIASFLRVQRGMLESAGARLNALRQSPYGFIRERLCHCQTLALIKAVSGRGRHTDP